MRTWLDVSGEFEVEISLDEVFAEVMDLPTDAREQRLLLALNKLVVFLYALPDEAICGLTARQAEIVGEALGRQANRFTSAAKGGHQERC